jgi:hypothetical protein
MIPQVEAAVRAGELTASLAADAVLGRLGAALIPRYGCWWP